MTNSIHTKGYWSDPRATIANKYQDNDYGYVFHATSILVDIIILAEINPSEYYQKKILDYGCGTARVARQVALTGAHVEAYDPVVECVEEATKEYEKIRSGNFPPPGVITFNLEEVSNEFDLIYSVNVLEHLQEDDFYLAIENIEDRMRDGGVSLLWIHRFKNSHFLIRNGIDLSYMKTSVAILRGQRSGDSVSYNPVFRKRVSD